MLWPFLQKFFKKIRSPLLQLVFVFILKLIFIPIHKHLPCTFDCFQSKTFSCWQIQFHTPPLIYMLAMYLCIEMSHTGLKKPNTVLTNIWFASSQTLIQNHTWCTNNTVILLGSIALFLTCMLRNQLSQF